MPNSCLFGIFVFWVLSLLILVLFTSVFIYTFELLPLASLESLLAGINGKATSFLSVWLYDDVDKIPLKFSELVFISWLVSFTRINEELDSLLLKPLKFSVKFEWFKLKFGLTIC